MGGQRRREIVGGRTGREGRRRWRKGEGEGRRRKVGRKRSWSADKEGMKQTEDRSKKEERKKKEGTTENGRRKEEAALFATCGLNLRGHPFIERHRDLPRSLRCRTRPWARLKSCQQRWRRRSNDGRQQPRAPKAAPTRKAMHVRATPRQTHHQQRRDEPPRRIGRQRVAARAGRPRRRHRPRRAAQRGHLGHQPRHS